MVTFQSIHQRKGLFPLETRVIPTQLLSAPAWSSGKKKLQVVHLRVMPRKIQALSFHS